MRLRATLIATAAITACSHHAAHGTPASLGQSHSGPSCASHRTINSFDYHKPSASGGSTVLPGYEFLEQWGLHNPVVCGNVTNDQLLSAGQQLVKRFPALCNPYPSERPMPNYASGQQYHDPRDGKNLTPIQDQALVDAAVAAFDASTNGGAIGWNQAERNEPEKLQSTDADRLMMNDEAVNAAAFVYCP